MKPQVWVYRICGIITQLIFTKTTLIQYDIECLITTQKIRLSSWIICQMNFLST